LQHGEEVVLVPFGAEFGVAQALAMVVLLDAVVTGISSSMFG
jgi:hypothetical protein